MRLLAEFNDAGVPVVLAELMPQGWELGKLRNRIRGGMADARDLEVLDRLLDVIEELGFDICLAR